MEENLTALNIEAKVLARKSNAVWDILLATEEMAKTLVGSILTTKMLRLQTEYMSTWKTCITLHELPMYITEDHLGAFFFRLQTSRRSILNQRQVGHCHQ